MRAAIMLKEGLKGSLREKERVDATVLARCDAPFEGFFDVQDRTRKPIGVCLDLRLNCRVFSGEPCCNVLFQASSVMLHHKQPVSVKLHICMSKMITTVLTWLPEPRACRVRRVGSRHVGRPLRPLSPPTCISAVTLERTARRKFL